MSKLILYVAVLVTPLIAGDPVARGWRAVADRLITTPVESYPFNWGEGVQMIGLVKAYERTQDSAYLDYLEKWTAQFLNTKIDRLLNLDSPAPGSRPGYCGYWSPATAILFLSKYRPRPEYRAIADGVTAYVRDTAERNPADGALGHWQGSHQLWVDTLYMACPLLSAMSLDRKDSALADDAARQILSYAAVLQNSRNGLFYHMWDWKTRARSESLWGRGNGWVIMSLADTFEALPPKDSLRAPLLQVAKRLIGGLRGTQDATGLWHTVMDEADSYPESSATAMVVYGLLKLIRLDVAGREDEAAALKAWSALNRQFVRDGLLSGASAGTDPGSNRQYNAKPVGVQTWGTGAYLLAASEVDRLPPVKLR